MRQRRLAVIVSATLFLVVPAGAAPTAGQEGDDLQQWQQQLVRQHEVLDEQFGDNGYTATTVRTAPGSWKHAARWRRTSSRSSGCTTLSTF